MDHRTCPTCGLSKTPRQFYSATNPVCRACSRPKGSTPPDTEIDGVLHRTCQECWEVRPLATGFDHQTGRPRVVCKPCARAKAKVSGAKARRATGAKVKWVRVVKVINGIEQQECRQCRTWKPVPDFYLTHVPRRLGEKRPDVICKECVKEQSRIWRETHPSPKRERDIDPAYWQAAKEKRRARKAKALVNDLTPEEWATLVTALGGRCTYCGDTPERLAQDHVVPISAGGNHTLANVTPVCRSCNSSKGHRPLQEWLAWRAARRQRGLQRAIARLETPLCHHHLDQVA